MKTWNQTLIMLSLSRANNPWVPALGAGDTQSCVHSSISHWQALHNISVMRLFTKLPSPRISLIGCTLGKSELGAFMTFCKYWHIITSHTLMCILVSFPSCQTASMTWCLMLFCIVLCDECFGSILCRPGSGHIHNIDSMTTRYPASVWVKPVTLKDNLNWQELPQDLFCLNLTT